MSYYQKYLKYKNKYLQLKSQIGGEIDLATFSTANPGLLSPKAGSSSMFLLNKEGEKCALITKRRNNILLEDFGIDKELKDASGKPFCTLKDTLSIIKVLRDKIREFVKDQTINVELDDNSYPVIDPTGPKINFVELKFTWDIIYLHANPDKPSIYMRDGSPFHYTEAFSEHLKTKDIKTIVETYKKANSYNLLENANKLQISLREYNKTKDESLLKTHNELLVEFKKQYTLFETYLKEILKIDNSSWHSFVENNDYNIYIMN
jgi:hypothetical protein